MLKEAAQRVFPYLYVENVPAYLKFLTDAFAFKTRIHEVDPGDPEHVHAEVVLGDAVIMIGHATAKWGTAAPRRLAGLPSGTFVLVEDVDAHCRHARSAGATIEQDPADQSWGARMYTARDPEGHQWYFATPA
jgi:uncharacterized glyoxalase superfamily protein PhnB